MSASRYADIRKQVRGYPCAYIRISSCQNADIRRHVYGYPQYCLRISAHIEGGYSADIREQISAEYPADIASGYPPDIRLISGGFTRISCRNTDFTSGGCPLNILRMSAEYLPGGCRPDIRPTSPGAVALDLGCRHAASHRLPADFIHYNPDMLNAKHTM